MKHFHLQFFCELKKSFIKYFWKIMRPWSLSRCFTCQIIVLFLPNLPSCLVPISLFIYKERNQQKYFWHRNFALCQSIIYSWCHILKSVYIYIYSPVRAHCLLYPHKDEEKKRTKGIRYISCGSRIQILTLWALLWIQRYFYISKTWKLVMSWRIMDKYTTSNTLQMFLYT